MDGTAVIWTDGPVRAEVVALGRNYRINHLTVEPGGVLDDELHRHRTEQFVILSGQARITRGAATIMVPEEASVFVPVGVSRRVENAGRGTLSLLQVQVGALSEEDDTEGA